MSTSNAVSESTDYWVKPMVERQAPIADWVRIGMVALLVLAAVVGLWEWQMRAAGLTTSDLDDNPGKWARERRKIDAGQGAVVISGSSRMLFNTDLRAWQSLTGVKPIQLAMRGTSPLPIVSDLARDPDFRGLLVIGYDPNPFFGRVQRAEDALRAVHGDPLFRRSGLWLHEQLSQVFAFLDREFRPMGFVIRWSIPQRTRRGPFNTPWKVSTAGADRQHALWARIETDAEYREFVRALWLDPQPVPSAAEIEEKFEMLSRDIAGIRARGGEVIFVRSPVDTPLRELEEQRFPTDKTWNRLLAVTAATGIDSALEPTLRDFKTVEYSHLGSADSTLFTRALVRLLDRSLNSQGKGYGGLGVGVDASLAL